MYMSVEDGTGGNSKLQIYKDNKLAGRVVTSAEQQEAVKEGRAWNFNTGFVGPISTNSALIYFLNNEDADFFISSVAVGLKDGSATDVQGLYFVANPTGGTLIDAATTADMICNRKIGSGLSLTSSSKVYKPTGTGQTLTGGQDCALFAQNDQGRLFATVDFYLPRGKACGIRVEVDGGFSGEMYVALICHKEKELC
tara:strand:- start:5380 stop:5970 length:591 start_codon:yes stop_codon:yes gene_type:complete